MERDALELEKVVRKEIENFPQNYRCHEGARMIARKLRSPAGMGVVVRDGGVVYDTSYFSKNLEDFSPASLFKDFENFSDEEKRGLTEELNAGEKKGKLFVIHSWCEFEDHNSKSTIVIDWHAHLKLPQNNGVHDLLIIDNKNNLPHAYIPMGIAFRKWIIFRTFPPQAIKLRM